MPLAHFKNIDPHMRYSAPIHLNYCEVNFGKEHEEIAEYCFKIEDDIAYFNVLYNTSTGKVDVIRFAQDYIQKKIDIVEVKYYNKEGEVISIVVIENFQFKEILNLFDFDWEGVKIKDLKVRFGYDKATFYDNYKQYIRKLKLDNIDSSSKETNFTIT